VGKADLHLHTRVSDGFATVEQLLDHVESATDLDLIAVTDHEDAAGGNRARERAAQRNYRFDVIVGAEITTLQGHLLALFIDHAPKSFRSIERTIDEIHWQGGLAVVPHPMSWLTRSISRRTMERLFAARASGAWFDAIEVANPSPAGKQTADKARALNRRWGLAETGGSDAHHLLHTGSGWTEFEGVTAEDLRAALLAGTTAGAMGRYPSFREVGYGKTALGLLWGYAATPRKMLRTARTPPREA
jgi:hypothetical protein